MTDKKMFEMIDSIPKFDTYSRYSQSLDRIFRHNSLKNLLSVLKNPKRLKLPEFSEEIQRSYRNSNDKNYTDQIDFSYVNYLERAEEELDSSIKNLKSSLKERKKKTEEEKSEIKHSHRKNVQSLKDTPEPGRYNPNYKAIYKRVPSVIIIKPTKQKNILHSYSQKEIFNKYKSKSIKNEGVVSEMSNENEEKTKIKSKQIFPPLNIFNKSNHALKFSQYTPRKPMINPSNSDNVISYLEPFDYLTNFKKAPDFKKMKVRADTDLINMSSIDVPSICYYKPKYEIIEKNLPKISFSPRSKGELNKKFLIKKIWNSYNVATDYQLVNLNANQKDISKNQVNK